jgi:6-phosphogluconolactonase
MMNSLVLLTITALVTTCANADRVHVYFGSGTTSEREGVFISTLDLDTGKLSEARLAGEVMRPGFIVIHPGGNHLYSIGKPAGSGELRDGSVCAFKIDPETGALEFLNMKPSQDTDPCYLTIDPSGRNILVAHYLGGSCASLPLGKDGSLKRVSSIRQHTGSSVDPSRQAMPHPHAIVLDATGCYAFVPDLGLDQVLIYKFDSTSGTLAPNDPSFVEVKLGGGPRHFVFHPSGKFAYTNLEITSEVTAFQYDSENGTLVEFQTLSTLPNGFSGKNTNSGICTTPDGRFLYVANRGHNSIVPFSINPNSGKLSPVGNQSTHALVPHAINMDTSGSGLIATDKNSGAVSVFKIDSKTGQLTHASSISVPKVGNIVFRPLD